MGLESYITDPSNHKKAHVVTHDDRNSNNALVVATHPLKEYINGGGLFFNPIHGIDLNIGVEFGTTPDEVYIDNTEWTASGIIGGGWDFASTGGVGVSPQGGTLCIDATTTVNNNVMQFARGSDLFLDGYVAISGYINITNWSAGSSVEFTGWDTGTGVEVGLTIDIADYITVEETFSWQKFVIPLEDMGLDGETIDALRVRTVSSGGHPDYYLDTIQIEEQGAVDIATFKLTPAKGTWLHINHLKWNIGATLDITLSNGTVSGMSYKDFMNIEGGLTNGILYQRVQNDIVQFSNTSHTIGDILSTPRSIFQTMSDATADTLFLVDQEFSQPVILKSENKDELRITISDNLAGLDLFRVFAGGWSESRVRDV